MADLDYQLTMRSGPKPGKTYPIEQEELLLGRDMENDIAISDPEVSRRHARFYLENSNIYVEDLGSTNGTFLNGERISSPQQLRPGDVITLGESLVLVF
ncbi:MAG: FHA domain-containing protein, partial [Brevefilum sp.]